MQSRKLAVGLAVVAAFMVVDSALAYYNPATGRFLNRDPIGEPGARVVHHVAATTSFIPRDSAGNPPCDSYQYARNSPLGWIDPDGGMEQPTSGFVTSTRPVGHYPPPDRTKSINTYNCAGLAFRNYKNLTSNDVQKVLEGFRVGLLDCESKCSPCEVKCWLWEWTAEAFIMRGNQEIALEFIVGGVKMRESRDFHIVCGQSGCAGGDDPTDCYSKFGPGPIEGPGKGGDFRPVMLERRVTDDGREYWIRRKAMSEHCFCGPLSALSL